VFEFEYLDDKLLDELLDFEEKKKKGPWKLLTYYLVLYIINNVTHDEDNVTN
jgi:hypothetical protein